MDLNIDIHHGEARTIHPWRYTKASAITQATGIEAAVAEIFDSACAQLDPWHPFFGSSLALRTLLHGTDHLAELDHLPSALNPLRRAASLEPGIKQAGASASGP